MAILISPVAQSASWFNLGNWYGASTGKLIWEINTTLLPNQITTTQTSTLSYLHQNQYQIHGYLWRPWISNFTIGTVLEYNALNIHDFNNSTHNFIPQIGSNLNLFPFSNFRGTIATDFKPLITHNNSSGWTDSYRASVRYKQTYNSMDNVKKYNFDYNWDRYSDVDSDTSYLNFAAAEGQQNFVSHKFREFGYWAYNYNDTTTDTTESANVGIKHNYTPEFYGLVFDNMASFSKASTISTGFENVPYKANILGSLSYKYDQEYIDLSRVPTFRFQYNLTAIENSSSVEAAYAGLTAHWPDSKRTRMNSSLGYNFTPTGEIYNANHSTSAIIPQITRNNFVYARSLSGNVAWQKSSLGSTGSVSAGAGHSANISTELKNATSATYFASQNVSDTFYIVTSTQNATLLHSLGFNINNEKHQSGMNFIDSRTNSSAESSQTLQASHRRNLQKSSTINASYSFSLNWNQTRIDSNMTSYTSAQAQYRHSNSMLYEIRNLKSAQTLTLDLREIDRSINYNANLSYFIGSTILNSELDVNYLEAYNISMTLKVTRLF